MTVAKAIRFLLALASACIVVWAFADVGWRVIGGYQARAQRPITLTILHWGDKDEGAIVQTLAEQYERQHPNVRIVRIHASDFRSKLKTMMSAGTPPDLFYLPPDMLAELAELKLIRPIDDLLEKDWTAGNGEWLDDFFPILIDAFRYDVATEHAGTGPLYGLPKDFTTAVFYANVDLFERAGVALPPDSGWTWDQFEEAARRITALNGRPGFEGRRIYGAVFELWPATLRNIVWTFGGDFFGKDFRDVTLDEPPAQAAMQLIKRMRLDEKTAYNATGIAKEGSQEFINGNIGMVGPAGRWKVPRFVADMNFRWDVVPVPYDVPAHRASQLFTTAWTMSSQSAHVEQAYDLMKFLCGPVGARMQSRLGLAIPPLKSIAYSEDFLNPPGIPKHNARLLLDAVPDARIEQNPRQAEWERIVGDRIGESLQLGLTDTLTNARQIERAWIDELNSPLRRQQWPPMNWTWILSITAAAVLTLSAVLYFKARREKLGPLDRATERAGWTFIAPWVIGFIALTLGPMLVSLLLGFTRWTGLTPLDDAHSVGLANYRQLFTADPTFFQSLRVTGYYVILAVPVTQVAALAVAMLMNLRIRGIAVWRTIYFLPSLITGAVLAVMWIQVFNNDYGILNKALAPIARLFGTTPPDWFGLDVRRWGIPAFVIMAVWGVGGGMLIYLAGLKGIPTSLYEAATIDGAGPARKFWNVTVPMLSPLIFYNLVMGIIGSFQVFTQAYLMTGPGPGNATLFYVLSLYMQAFEFHNMGYASAMAWVLFVIVLLLTLLVFRGSRKLVYYEGLRA